MRTINLTLALALLPILIFAQSFEYNYYPNYGDLDKKAYALLKGYTKKEFDRRPTSQEVEQTSFQINEAFAYLGIPAFHQRGDRKAVKVRLKAIELAVKRFGPYFRVVDVHDCYAELTVGEYRHKSKRTNHLVNLSYSKKTEGLVVK